MIIKEKSAFLPFIIKMLNSLGYEQVEKASGKSYDITANKDGKKYCFKCQYDIDAVSERSMLDLVEGSSGENFDERVFVTNSSFISAAKKVGDRAGVQLWDRNTVDRMCIGVKDEIDDIEIEESSSKIGAIAGAVVVLLLIAAAAVYFFLFR